MLSWVEHEKFYNTGPISARAFVLADQSLRYLPDSDLRQRLLKEYHAKTLIRLHGYMDWPESSLGIHAIML